MKMQNYTAMSLKLKVFATQQRNEKRVGTYLHRNIIIIGILTVRQVKNYAELNPPDIAERLQLT